MENKIPIVCLILICTLYLVTSTLAQMSSSPRRKEKERVKEKTSKTPQILCQTDDPTAALHCFCNSDVYNNASRAECFVFTNVSEDHPVWNLFTTQINIVELTITLRFDKKLCFVPTRALKPLKRLQKLTIKYASITEIHPYAFANSSTLREIIISRNQIEMLAPYAFAHLPSLEYLTLDRNRLSELNRNVFFDLQRLQTLYISENNLSVLHDGAFKHLGALQNLDLDKNALVVVTRDTFIGLSALKRLDLSHNRLTLLGDLTFAELWSLEFLNLESNELQVISERAFDGLTQLKELKLRKNHLTTLPGGLLEGVPTVNNLDLRDNQLQTLTQENIRPIYDTLRNTSSTLHIELYSETKYFPTMKYLAILLTLLSVWSLPTDGTSSDYCNVRCFGGNSVHTKCLPFKCQVSKPCSDMQQVPLSDADKQLIVRIHNDFRDQFVNGVHKQFRRACDMKRIVWDEELASIAQCWANACKFEHDRCRNTIKNEYVGQNLAMTGSTSQNIFSPSKSAETIRQLIALWTDELKLFTPNERMVLQEDNWQATGHFTQLIWGKTERVGCGRVHLKDGGYYQVQLVCNYGPGGNMFNDRIYQTQC